QSVCHARPCQSFDPQRSNVYPKGISAPIRQPCPQSRLAPSPPALPLGRGPRAAWPSWQRSPPLQTECSARLSSKVSSKASSNRQTRADKTADKARPVCRSKDHRIVVHLPPMGQHYDTVYPVKQHQTNPPKQFGARLKQAHIRRGDILRQNQDRDIA